MHAIEKQLYQDHYHMGRLLRCLERAVERFSTEGGEGLSLILDAMDYLRAYPEHWHHPVEDQVFAHLVRQYPYYSRIVEDLHREHQRLVKLSAEVESLFQAIANDTVVPMKLLLRKVSEYLTLQGRHIDRENELAFPLMHTCLTDEDWQQIEKAVEFVKDPLFGDQRRQQYLSLYAHIQREEIALAEESSDLAPDLFDHATGGKDDLIVDLQLAAGKSQRSSSTSYH